MRIRLDTAPTTIAVTIGMVSLAGHWSRLVDVDTPARSVIAVLAVGISALAGRVVRLPGGLVVALQGVALGIAAFVPDLAATDIEGFRKVPAQLAEAGIALRTGAIPIDTSPGAIWLTALLLGGLTIAADTVAVELERPGWGTIPLLVAYAIPTLAAPSPSPVADFALLGVGVALVLVTRSLTGTGHTTGSRGAFTRGAAVGFALVVALGSVAGSALLTEQIHLEPRIEFSDEPIEMNDPSLDLKRNLVEGTTDTIIEFRTDLPDPPPLRLVSLKRFSDSGFHLVETRISHGPIPPVPGLRNPTTRRVTEVEIGQFASEWLPAPYAPLSVNTDERWGFTELGLEILALSFPGRTSATVDMSYTVTSAEARPSSEELASLQAGRPPDVEVTLELPGSVSPQLRNLVAEITAGAQTDGQKAMAIEQFFHTSPFTYSTEPAPGTGVAGLEAFLFDTHEGYCEQYAGAMAAMARAAGIPSRIGIGFHPGDQDSDGIWRVSERDMHAWPELYFADWGWVAFEPTPGESGGEEPDSTPEEAEPEPEPTEDELPEVESPEEPAQDPEPEPETAAGPSGLLMWIVIASLVLAGLAVTPATVRAAQRRKRLDPTLTGNAAALKAWRELEATASDLGMEWPSGSPRFAAEELSDNLGPEAAEALWEVALATEHALFADPESSVTAMNVGEEALKVVDAWRAAEPGRARRAFWWPRSIWS